MPPLNSTAGLRCWTVILAPQHRGVLSKGGTMDDTILLDRTDDLDLGPLLMRLHRRSQPKATFFRIQAQQYNRLFHECAGALHLDLESPYQWRHGGASRDFLLKRRDLESIRKRLQHKSYSSVRRYEKAGRLRLAIQNTPQASWAYCVQAAANLQCWFRSPHLIPRPPWG